MFLRVLCVLLMINDWHISISNRNNTYQAYSSPKKISKCQLRIVPYSTANWKWLIYFCNCPNCAWDMCFIKFDLLLNFSLIMLGPLVSICLKVGHLKLFLNLLIQSVFYSILLTKHKKKFYCLEKNSLHCVKSDLFLLKIRRTIQVKAWKSNYWLN